MDKQIFTSLNKEQLKEIIKECISETGSNATSSDEIEFIKADEACSILKVSKVTLHKWINEGKIDAYYIGSRLYFKKSEIINSPSKK